MPAKKTRSQTRHVTEPVEPPRIPLATAIRLMDGVVSRAEFFARYRFDPEIIRRLDIRRHPTKARAQHCDRAAVLAWIAELTEGHELAIGPDKTAENLGHHARGSRPATTEKSYGNQLAILNQALAAGTITREQFERALADLEVRS